MVETIIIVGLAVTLLIFFWWVETYDDAEGQPRNRDPYVIRTDEGWKMTYCDLVFPSRSELRKHMKSGHCGRLI